MASPRLYFETLRHLRSVQIVGRAWHRVPRPRPRDAPAPLLRRAVGDFVPPAPRAPILLGPDEVRILNVRRCLRGAKAWDDPADAYLWRYHLHYFDDLNAEGAASRAGWHRDLIGRWLAQNPPGGGVGWEPYPLSRRIVNWIHWLRRGEVPPRGMVHSLANQVRALRGRLEWHLLGNHLLANAKALVIAGLFFDGPEALGWRTRGAQILERELAEQILPCGGHFERSPMYHALVLEDLLDVVATARHYGDSAVAQIAARPVVSMRRWLAAMCHPDGEIAFFNDAAYGMAPPPRALETYARRLGFGAAPAIADGALWLESSGYVRLQVDDAVVIVDVGDIGPDYLPGHAHADTLSIEASVGGHRLLVNSGTSGYGTGPERGRERGTAAHNTVEVDGQDSSEVWAGFRVARRARPRDVRVDGLTISAAHDGYRRLPGDVMHRRDVTLAAGALAVEDRLEGAPQTAVARFHLHPDVGVETPELGWFTRGALAGPSRRVEWSVDGGRARIEGARYGVRFGEICANRRIATTFTAAHAIHRFAWRSSSCTSSS